MWDYLYDIMVPQTSYEWIKLVWVFALTYLLIRFMETAWYQARGLVGKVLAYLGFILGLVVLNSLLVSPITALILGVEIAVIP